MRVALVVLVVSACLAPLMQAEEVQQPTAAKPIGGGPLTNAAPVYWQAFAILPTLTPEEQAQFDAAFEASSKPVPADVKRLVERYDAALKAMHRAAAAKMCDWELDYAEGPMLLLPHLAKLRELGRVAQIRARVRYEVGDIAGAMSDLTTSLKMARDSAISPNLVAYLVGMRIETAATDLLAEYLPRLDRAALDRLQKQLALLPATPSVADCLSTGELAFVDWLEAQFKDELTLSADTKVGHKVVRVLRLIGGNLSEDEANAAVASMETVAKLRAALARVRKEYAVVAHISGLKSPQERRDRIKQFDDELKKSISDPDKMEPDRWLALQITPAASVMNAREIERDVRRELLRVAILVQRDGQEIVKSAGFHGDGTLEYEARSAGFVLRYRDAPTDPWEVLQVGPREK